MIFVGVVKGNKEIAFRFDTANAEEGCYYDIRKLPKGTIRRIMKNNMKVGDDPKPYSGEFELKFEKLRKYK